MSQDRSAHGLAAPISEQPGTPVMCATPPSDITSAILVSVLDPDSLVTLCACSNTGQERLALIVYHMPHPDSPDCRCCTTMAHLRGSETFAHTCRQPTFQPVARGTFLAFFAKTLFSSQASTMMADVIEDAGFRKGHVGGSHACGQVHVRSLECVNA